MEGAAFLTFAVLICAGFLCMLVAFSIVAIYGWETAVIRPRREGRWTWAAELMVAGAAMGVAVGTIILVAAFLT